MSASQQSFARRIVEFSRFAHRCDLHATVKESLDAIRALVIVGISDRESVKVALRAVMCSSKEEWDLFDEVFDSFWRAPSGESSGREDLATPRRKSKEPGSPSQERLASLLGQAAGSPESDEGRAVLGATAVERLKKIDFSEIPQRDLQELEQVALRLIRQMSLRISRRLKALAPSGRVDIRRTIRHSIGCGGELLELSFRGRKRQRGRLVMLLDISGSMNAYSIFLLRFAFVLQRHFPRSSTFVFSTRLEDIGPALRGRRLDHALAALSASACGWSGGTRIGDSLHEFNLLHARRVLTHDAIVIILSDGWDTGEPELLSHELAAIKRRGRKLIWLNPLLGMADYQPVTRGMSAALPWIDVFAPAHNLESLLALETHLAHR